MTVTGEMVESIERATLAAVAPAEVAEFDGWLVALDPGTIRRAASAVPLALPPRRVRAGLALCLLEPARLIFQQGARPAEDVLEHGRRQPPGVRVEPRAVVAVDHPVGAGVELAAVPRNAG